MAMLFTGGAVVTMDPQPGDLPRGDVLISGTEIVAAVAHDLDIAVSVDAVFGAESSEAILAWEKQGLLGPDLELIHATGLTPDAWRAIGATGTTISLAPSSDTQIGLETAIPAIDEALAAGVRPGLSIDVEVALAGDMFTQISVAKRRPPRRAEFWP